MSKYMDPETGCTVSSMTAES